MASIVHRISALMRTPAPKFPGRLRSRLKHEARVELTINFEDAHRAKRLEQWRARRTEQRVIDSLNRRGISSAQPTRRPIPPYVKLIVRPGARVLDERGHINTTSETFRAARKRTRYMQHRMAQDEEAAKMLYNAREVVNGWSEYLVVTSANTLAHASSLYKFACYLQESLPCFQRLQRTIDPPAPKFFGFERNIGWDWAKLLGMFRHSFHMHEDSDWQTRNGVIAARTKFAEYAGQIRLTDGDTLNYVMEDIVFASPATARNEAIDISHDLDYMDDIEMASQNEDARKTLNEAMDPADATGFPPTATPIQGSTAPHPNPTTPSTVPVQFSNIPQLETKSRSPPQPTADSEENTQPDGGHSQNTPSQTREPAVSGLKAIWAKKQAEAAATRSNAKKQAAAARNASFSPRKPLPAVPEEDDKDTKSDTDSEDASVDYVDCKDTQMRTPESLRSLQQLLKEFSRRDFQKLLTYEFTDENIGFEINELYTTGEEVDKSSVACIVLACQYIVCSRRRKIARASQMLQEQVFRDLQVNLRRLQQRLEKKEKTPEFRGDETLVSLLADVRKVGGILEEDGQVAWTI